MPNPLMSESMYSKVWKDKKEPMTLEWTINKALFLVILTIASAIWVWNYSALFLPYILPLILVWFGIALIIIFKKETAPYLAPVYAIMEWLIIWVISAMYEVQFPWIVIQTISLTFGVFMIMLLLYRTKVLQATENFKIWVVAATWAIMMIYMVSLLWWLTWWFDVPYIHESGLVWILFSVFVVWIASLNLILDFDNIEIWVKMKSPKFMEWYSSFWLLVTLIWLYLEILKLLSKLRSR